jgi:hypothetical protein
MEREQNPSGTKKNILGFAKKHSWRCDMTKSPRKEFFT